MKRIERFFGYARERYRIFLARRSGLPAPWTVDPILRVNRFCNVFREDDRTTIWFRDNVREPLRNSPDVLFATIAFRWFNRIETGEILRRGGLLVRWSEKRARALLENVRPLVTGSFMVQSPYGKNKLEGMLEMCSAAWERRGELLEAVRRAGTLEGATRELQVLENVGGFVAYEIVTDLRHTWLLEGAPDINSWANPGPGATRGAKWVARGTVAAPMSRAAILDFMQYLLACSLVKPYWPQAWPRWEMREVEHTLCEVFKYQRCQNGGKTKVLFRNGGK